MIQINLLPDVKQEYLRTQQTKHTVIVGSALISAVVLGVTVLLFVYVQIVQPQYQRVVQNDIDKGIQELKEKPDAQRLVTVQGVLEQMPALKDQQQVISRIFNYLKEFTPRSVAYNQVNLALDTSTITLSGGTVSYEQANVLANNLKSAKMTYRQGDSDQTASPYQNIVFNSLSKAENANDGRPVTFELTFQFNPLLFNPTISNQKVTVNASSEELLLPSSQPFDATETLLPTSGGVAP